MSKDMYKDLSLIIAEKQKVIDQLTKDKFSLLKIISHDIRSPFNQLFALLQLMELEAEDMGEEMKGYIDKMYHSVIAGMEMIKNLHDMRALDQDTISLNPERFNLLQLISQVIRQFKIQSRLKNITIKLEQEIEDVEINSDRILLKKILENVISNALKFSESGTSVILRATKNDDSVFISALDHGPGLPANEISQIFHKFKKLSTTPSQGEATTGLGMFLAKEFAGMLNASIDVKNSESGGLLVELKVPFVLSYSE